MNRQCSIGYHNECSDPNGYECDCECHLYLNAIEIRKAVEELEFIDQYGGWDESREDMHNWIRKDQVLDLLKPAEREEF